MNPTYGFKKRAFFSVASTLLSDVSSKRKRPKPKK